MKYDYHTNTFNNDMDITIKKEIEIKDEELDLLEENYHDGDTRQQGYQDNVTGRQEQQYEGTWNQHQMSTDALLKDFNNQIYPPPLNIKAEEDCKQTVERELRVKVKKGELNGGHRLSALQTNSKVKIPSQQAVKQEIKEVEEEEEDRETFFRRLQESKFPIILLKKSNLKDTVVRKDKHDLSKDNKKFKEKNVEDENENKEKSEILFQRLQDSTFPIILLKKLKLEEEKVSCDERDEEKSSLKPNSSNSQQLYIRKYCKRTKKNYYYKLTSVKERSCKTSIETSAKKRTKTSIETSAIKGTKVITSKLKKFKCFVCNYETKYKRNLQRHMLNHSKTKVFGCSTCNYKTYHEQNLKRHILNHLDVKYYKCFECNYKTNHKSNLKSHLNRHFNLTKSNSDLSYLNLGQPLELLDCLQCNLKFKQRSNLKVHLLNHLGVKSLQCPDCEYRTNDPSNFRRHKFTHKPTSSSQFFNCNDCNFSTPRKDNLKTHILSKHSDSKPFYKCSSCAFTTHRMDTLRIHETIHTKSRLFCCAECSYETNFKSALKKHIMNFHSKPRSFICSICNFKSNGKTDLFKHLSTHPNMKELICPHCIYVAKTKDSFKQHLSSHSETKYLKCSFCTYKTNLKGNLGRHIKRHHCSIKV